MNIQDKVSDAVTENFRTSTIFKKFGIDFCCNGNITIETACEKKDVDLNELMNALKNTNEERKSSENFKNWDSNFLIEYIINNHHNYLREMLPAIEQYTLKVARVHGGNRKSLIEIHDLFLRVKDDLLSHLDEEENVLFPLIKKMEAGYEATAKERVLFSKIDEEHKVIGDLLKKINDLSDNYHPPADACNTYRVSFQYLSELEDDIHKHIHLENNILIQRVIKL